MRFKMIDFGSICILFVSALAIDTPMNNLAADKCENRPH